MARVDGDECASDVIVTNRQSLGRSYYYYLLRLNVICETFIRRALII